VRYTVTSIKKYTEVPKDKRILFSAYIKLGDIALEKTIAHEKSLLKILAVMGGAYRSVHFICNFLVVIVARKLFMLNMLN